MTIAASMFAKALPQPMFEFARGAADRYIPARRRVREQWQRIDDATASIAGEVQSGPFQGMRLMGATTGSHIPKRIGCYERELHAEFERVIADGYERIVDVGCGEGWYVVGLARRIPRAEVWGFDISPMARQLCLEAAAANDVGERVRVRGACTPNDLVSLADKSLLVVVDAEGAERELISGPALPALATADLIIELHEFAAPGVTEQLRSKLGPSHELTMIQQTPRRGADYPQLRNLSAVDADRAVSESRVPDQEWLIARSRLKTS